MRIRREGACGCDPEEVFELADGALAPGREREAREHLRGCAGCRRLYRRQISLNTSLRSLHFSRPETRSVREEVALALPTRRLKARLLWVLLAGVLLLGALFALGASGASPPVSVLDTLGVFWAYTAAFSDTVYTLLDVAGPAILVALVAGAVFDLLLAGIILAAIRRARAA